MYSILVVTTRDTTFYAGGFSYWGLAELAIGIVCSCLSVSPKFIRTIGPQICSFPTALFSSHRFRTTATTTPRWGTARLSHGTDPYDKLKDDIGEHSREAWEMTPSCGKKNVAEITGSSSKMSDAKLVRNGSNSHIFETLSFDIESFIQRDASQQGLAA